MKQLIILVLGFVLIGCEHAAEPVRQNINSANTPANSSKSQTVIAHTTENRAPILNTNTGGAAKWSQSGDPIDTTGFDKAIADAGKLVNARPTDEAAKTALADAYFKRGFALTEARQYASALGDFRRALKHNPDHEEAKNWMDQIISIYGMLKKGYPKEGEEPPPLPFKKT